MGGLGTGDEVRGRERLSSGTHLNASLCSDLYEVPKGFANTLMSVLRRLPEKVLPKARGLQIGCEKLSRVNSYKYKRKLYAAEQQDGN